VILGAILGLITAFLGGRLVYEAFIQKKSTLQRNFPLIIHGRYWLEKLGAPLRQYIISSDTSERPFNRNTRSWVYASSKGENNVIGFGSQVDHHAPGTVHIMPSLFPAAATEAEELVMLPPVIGARRREPYQPRSFFNISGMSFGALSSNAVRALSAGAAKAGIYMSTGEGAISPYHLEGGCDICFQIGPAKFGVRTAEGKFDEERLVELCRLNPAIKLIEIKLAQGAKPGKGGVLPKEKITEEISKIRGIPMGKDCHSPNSHAEIRSHDELLNFVERIAELTGKPTGIKLVGGGRAEAEALVSRMKETGRVPDFIIVDGTEGGSGAAPLALADYVGLPLREAIYQMDTELRQAGLRGRTVLIGSGKIATGGDIAQALAMGADMVNIARGFMLSLGCIQAMQCHTNHCPTGIATQSRYLQRGLDPTSKSERVANYARTLRKDLFMILHSCGLMDPKKLNREHLTLVVAPGQTRSMRELYPYPDDAESILKEQWINLSAPAGGGSPGPKKLA
jgi:glutamate synthase domain-containing protein 2